MNEIKTKYFTMPEVFYLSTFRGSEKTLNPGLFNKLIW